MRSPKQVPCTLKRHLWSRPWRRYVPRGSQARVDTRQRIRHAGSRGVARRTLTALRMHRANVRVAGQWRLPSAFRTVPRLCHRPSCHSCDDVAASPVQSTPAAEAHVATDSSMRHASSYHSAVSGPRGRPRTSRLPIRRPSAPRRSHTATGGALTITSATTTMAPATIKGLPCRVVIEAPLWPHPPCVGARSPRLYLPCLRLQEPDEQRVFPGKPGRCVPDPRERV